MRHWSMLTLVLAAAATAWGQAAPSDAARPAVEASGTSEAASDAGVEADAEGEADDAFPAPQWTRLELDEALEIVDLLSPTLAAELRLQRDSDTEADARVAATLLEEFPRVRDLLDLKRRDREVFDLRIRDLQTGRELDDAIERLRALSYKVDAEPEAVQAAVREMRKRVEDQFRVRHDMRALEVRRLRERVDDLKGRLDERWDDRHQYVDQRLEDLIAREGLVTPGE